MPTGDDRESNRTDRESDRNLRGIRQEPAWNQTGADKGSVRQTRGQSGRQGVRLQTRGQSGRQGVSQADKGSDCRQGVRQIDKG